LYWKPRFTTDVRLRKGAEKEEKEKEEEEEEGRGRNSRN
jgi:hypothetical protein